MTSATSFRVIQIYPFISPFTKSTVGSSMTSWTIESLSTAERTISRKLILSASQKSKYKMWSKSWRLFLMVCSRARVVWLAPTPTPLALMPFCSFNSRMPEINRKSMARCLSSTWLAVREAQTPSIRISRRGWMGQRLTRACSHSKSASELWTLRKSILRFVAASWLRYWRTLSLVIVRRRW